MAIDRKKIIGLIIIAGVTIIIIAVLYTSVKNTQRDLDILKLGMENDPKKLMMSGNMSVKDFCDHFYSDDPQFCDAYKK